MRGFGFDIFQILFKRFYSVIHLLKQGKDFIVNIPTLSGYRYT